MIKQDKSKQKCKNDVINYKYLKYLLGHKIFFIDF